MKKRRCFIIFTPYQLMTCFNIVSQYDEFGLVLFSLNGYYHVYNLGFGFI